MIVVVNDANILIDIIKLKLVDAFFDLNWEFHSTNLIIENELYDEQVEVLQPYIDKGRLVIDELSADEVIAIIEIQNEKPQLSDKDCSALVCAKKLKASLLTSDNTLRKFARQKDIEVHGHLWVLDAMVEQNCISAFKAVQKLDELDKVNSKLKLPSKECEERIRKWSRKK
jgi:predicted nucleic acid-binding protein